jgi:hypothetical protein
MAAVTSRAVEREGGAWVADMAEFTQEFALWLVNRPSSARSW